MPGSKYQRIAHVDNNGGASSSLISPVFDLYDFLLVHIRITGYSAAAIARLRFNGDTNTTAYAYSVMEGNAAPTTAVSGVAAGINVATTAQVARSLIQVRIRNVAGQVHGIAWTGSSGSESAGTAPAIVQGAAIWTTTNQITQITLDVGSGGGTLSASSSMDIYGCL